MQDAKKIKENPTYTANKELYQKYLDFYKGGSNVEGKPLYLTQHDYEVDRQYKIRLSFSTYKNFVEAIVAVFSSTIMRQEPSRILPKRLEELMDDIDGKKTSANTFFQRLCEQIAAMGVYFVNVDSPIAKTGQITRTDSEAQNIRPKLIPVSPLDLISWAYKDQELEYAVIQERKIENQSPFADFEEIIQYRIWKKDGWYLYQEGQTGSLEYQDAGTHIADEIPIVAGYFKKEDEDMSGRSCFDKILSLLVRAYNLENAYDKCLYDTAFPLLSILGAEPDQVAGFVKASSNVFAHPESDTKIAYVETSNKAYDALDKKIKSDEVDIFKIILRMLRPDSKQIESAESKKIDKEQLESQLTRFSDNCQSMETNCWRLLGKGLNCTPAEMNQIEITYHKDFDTFKIGADMIKALGEIRVQGDLSRSTFWEILYDGEVMPKSFDPDTEREKIEEDSRSDPDSDFEVATSEAEKVEKEDK